MAELPEDILRDVVLDKLIVGQSLNQEETDYYNQQKDNSDFQFDLQLLKDLHGPLAIENKSLLKAQLIEKEQHIQKAKRPIRLMPALAIAASFVALIAVSFLFWPAQSNSELFSKHYDVYPSIINPIVKGEQTATSKLEKAMLEYQQANFQTASDELKSINIQSDTVLFYLAMSQIEMNQLAAAQQNLELIDKQTSRFYKESQWYSALLFLRQDQIEKAKSQLQSIVNSEEHPYALEAARLIREMK